VSMPHRADFSCEAGTARHGCRRGSQAHLICRQGGHPAVVGGLQGVLAHRHAAGLFTQQRAQPKQQHSTNAIDATSHSSTSFSTDQRDPWAPVRKARTTSMRQPVFSPRTMDSAKTRATCPTQLRPQIHLSSALEMGFLHLHDETRLKKRCAHGAQTGLGRYVGLP